MPIDTPNEPRGFAGDPKGLKTPKHIRFAEQLPTEPLGACIVATEATSNLAFLNEHNNTTEKLLAQLRTFDAGLRNQEEPVEDPRIEEELTKVVDLVVDTIPQVENVEDI